MGLVYYRHANLRPNHRLKDSLRYGYADEMIEGYIKQARLDIAPKSFAHASIATDIGENSFFILSYLRCRSVRGVFFLK